MAPSVERPTLPGDVVVERAAIVDTALDQSYPVSASAGQVLALFGEGLSLADVASRLAPSAAVAPARIERDLREFVYRLNDADLMNIDLGGIHRELQHFGRSLALAVLSRGWPRLRRRRYPLRNRSLLHVHADVLRAVLLGLWPWWVLLAGVCLVGLVADPRDVAVLSFVPALLAAAVIHEVGHAIAVGRRGGGAFLSVVGLSVRVVHSPQHSGFIVHASGGVLALGWATVLLALAWISGVSAFALASGPFVANALALTVLSTDGRQLVAGR